MRPKTVLYVQHASSQAGSAVSLRTTLQALDRKRFRPVVAFAQPNRAAMQAVAQLDVAVLPWPGLGLWNHLSAIERPAHRVRTWAYLAGVAARHRAGQRRMAALLDHVRPDLVHLNSVVLLAAAQAVAARHVPGVWHVREHPPTSLSGLRNAIFRRALRTLPLWPVFISEADRRAWIGGGRGSVIPNFVLPPAAVSRGAARRTLNLPQSAPVLLYLGGLDPAKGIDVLLEALAVLAPRLPQLRCLAPGSALPSPTAWPLRLARHVLPLVGRKTRAQDAAARAECLGDLFVPSPHTPNIATFMAACDLVVFPAVAPHFARPVIEAAAAARAAAACDLPGPDELIVDGETGVLLPPGNAPAWAAGLEALLTAPRTCRLLGTRAQRRARHLYDARRNTAALMDVYDRLAT